MTLHIWSKQKKKMMSLFNLNVSNVFDNVSHIRLLYNIKKILKRFWNWVENFLKNKSIILIIENYTQTKRTTSVNILQNLLLFSVLYLFYNADLLNACDDIKLRFNFTEFVDDINILIYDEFKKRNCEILKKIWNKVVEWAKNHDFKFIEKKHELIHFSKILKKYNMSANIALSEH